MDWNRILTALDACPIVPVLSIPEAEHAEPLARALAEGGITVSEITLRPPAGLGAIGTFKAACPDMVVGAGTILDSQGLTTAVNAGADFIVSPGFDASLLTKLATCPVPVMPGIATPGEAIAARNAGILRVKLFPAGVVGGASMIKALGAPIQDMGFMPTGGVTLDNLSDYLSLPNVYAVGGTWIAKPEHLVAGDWDGIAERASQALAAAKAIRP